MKSLDPRINRMQIPENWPDSMEKESLDQLETYEVFVQTKEGKPYQHEGIVHASDEEMAFIFAKEQFSRRLTCTGIKIARTSNIYVSDFSEAEESIYDSVKPVSSQEQPEESYTVFHLFKRGKQHKLAGEVRAGSPDQALFQSKLDLDPGKPVYNVWVVRSDDILTISNESIWDTLPEKTFRQPIDYRGAEKIKKFQEEKRPGS